MSIFPIKIPIKSRKFVTTLVIIGIIVVLSGVFGFIYYNNWQKKRDEISNYLNPNITIYNQTSEDSKKLIEELNLLVEFNTNDISDTQNRIQQIRNKIKEIQQLNEQINKTSNEISPGNSPDTKELSSSFKNTLATKRFTLEALLLFLEYQVCLVDNATQQSGNLKEFTNQITKFSKSEGITIEEKNKFIQAANDKIKQNTTLSTQIKSCFKDSYSKYYTDSLGNLIKQDQKLYENFSVSLNSLENGLKTNKTDEVIKSTTELVALADQEIKTFSSQELITAIKQPTKEIQEQAKILSNEEELLSTKLTNIKNKYFLNTK
jgi:hypothetical protein